MVSERGGCVFVIDERYVLILLFEFVVIDWYLVFVLIME